jgi:Uri superfamily endonuclease
LKKSNFYRAEDTLPLKKIKMEIPARHGSYIVIGRLDNAVLLTSGPFSGQQITPGYYLYSGSAYGPGGLRARITRHLKSDTKKFWHFDHLKSNLSIEEIFFSIDTKNQECEFIKTIQGMPSVSIPLPGFGSSDCRKGCPAHLVKFPLSMDIKLVFDILTEKFLNLQRFSLQ